ncbi:GrlR family regulatory protein [Pseudomonas syringae]|uniref:GrlR family regulatory protein n=1 Tax=Pseudomonas syringae TaxID=317 RepID=UPI0009453F42|nr:GrlR family regulatory protein [Pseudomonas syringae]
MKDGLYSVNFKSSSQDFGSGVISVQKGNVNGGDHGYFYQGQIVVSDSKLSGTIQIIQWNPNVPSVFGPIPKFDLTLAGQFEGDSFELQGSVAGQAIRIVGRYLAELV